MTEAPTSSTVVLTDLAMIRGNANVPVYPSFAAKDPNTDTVRSVDFSSLLGNRSIVGVTYAADGVQIVSAIADWSLLTLLLRGGTDGTTARIELRVTCTDGTAEPAVILLPIVSQLTLPGANAVNPTQSITTNGIVGGVLGPLAIYAPQGASIDIRGTILARNLDTGGTMSWDVAVTIRGFGLDSAAIAQQSLTPFQEDASMAACTVSASVSSQSVMFPVVGVTNAAIAWSYNLSWAAA